MDGIRAPLGTLVEWLVAAVCLLGLTVLGSLFFQPAASVSPDFRAASRLSSTPLPVGISGRAVSVPMVVLLDGKEVRVGDSEGRIATLLGRAAETGDQVVGLRGPIEQVTRFYEHAGCRFALVFERLAPDAEPTVSSIFVQQSRRP